MVATLRCRQTPAATTIRIISMSVRCCVANVPTRFARLVASQVRCAFSGAATHCTGYRPFTATRCASWAYLSMSSVRVWLATRRSTPRSTALGRNKVPSGEVSMTHHANAKLQQWLDQEVPEEVLEPDLPIIDPHHHLWDLRTFTIQPHASFEQKVYLCEEIVEDISAAGHKVTQTVFAQCAAFYRAQGP